MSDATEWIVDPAGHLRGVYDERIDYSSIGEVTIRRASHVEPAGGMTWTADLTPVGGPVLGPFTVRSEAIAAEVAWLRLHLTNQTLLIKDQTHE